MRKLKWLLLSLSLALVVTSCGPKNSDAKAAEESSSVEAPSEEVIAEEQKEETEETEEEAKLDRIEGDYKLFAAEFEGVYYDTSETEQDLSIKLFEDGTALVRANGELVEGSWEQKDSKIHLVDQTEELELEIEKGIMRIEQDDMIMILATEDADVSGLDVHPLSELAGDADTSVSAEPAEGTLEAYYATTEKQAELRELEKKSLSSYSDVYYDAKYFASGNTFYYQYYMNTDMTEFPEDSIESSDAALKEANDTMLPSIEEESGVTGIEIVYEYYNSNGDLIYSYPRN